jgi:hypothetical protein
MAISSAIFTNLAMQQLKELLPQIQGSDIENFISGTSGKLLGDLPKQQTAQVLDILVQAMVPA